MNHEEIIQKYLLDLTDSVSDYEHQSEMRFKALEIFDRLKSDSFLRHLHLTDPKATAGAIFFLVGVITKHRMLQIQVGKLLHIHGTTIGLYYRVISEHLGLDKYGAEKLRGKTLR